MAGNSLITPDIIARGMLEVMHNACPMISRVERQYDKSFGEGAMVNGNMPGPSIRIRKPVRSTVTEGAALDVQDTVEDAIVLTQSTRLQISRIFTSNDLTLTVSEFGPRYIEPAAKALASKAEQQLTALYKTVYNSVGTVGTSPTGAQVYLDGRAKMNNYAVPTADRFAVLTPEAEASTVNGFTNFFNPQPTIGKQFIEGEMGSRALGMDWYMDQNLFAHTCGTRDTSGSAFVTDANQSGATIVCDATTAETFNAGDVFTIDGVYQVNYETKAPTANLQDFVVTADATASSSSVTLSISPAIITSGPTQTVYTTNGNKPASKAALRFKGVASAVSPQSMLVHKSAFTLASAPLYMPDGVDWKARADGEGLSIRVIRQYVINSDSLPVRMDILMGVKTLYEFAACRVWG